MVASSLPKPASAPRRSPGPQPWVKPLLFVLCLGPLSWLTGSAWANTLGPNPAEALIRGTGDWTLRFLCATLAITPVRTWLHQPTLVQFRRMLGLFTFFYGVLHFLCYSFFDMGWVWEDIMRDVAKRPFILVGTTALLLMAPLALTSFNRAIKALGAVHWRRLHRLVYATALLGLLHFFWMRAAKHNFAEVAMYAVVLGLLLGWRVLRWWQTHGFAQKLSSRK